MRLLTIIPLAAIALVPVALSACHEADGKLQSILCTMAYQQGDWPKASRFCFLAAKEGIPSAEFRYGTMLWVGLGIKRDEAAARRYLSLAAKGGNIKSRAWLQKHTTQVASAGSSASINLARMRRIATLLSTAHIADSLGREVISYFSKGDYQGAYRALLAAYNAGESSAAMAIGLLNLSRETGFPWADQQIGEMWIEKAAIRGRTDAKILLFQLLINKGTDPVDPVDILAALSSIDQAAERGDLRAQMYAAQVYAFGVPGTPLKADPKRAEHFYDLAAVGAPPRTVETIAEAYERGQGVPQRLDKAIKLYVQEGNEGEPHGYNAAAWLMATCDSPSITGRGRALNLVNKAITADPAEPSYVDTLAAVYASYGEYDEAVATEQRAVNMTKAEYPDMKDAIARYESRVTTYQDSRPLAIPCRESSRASTTIDIE